MQRYVGKMSCNVFVKESRFRQQVFNSDKKFVFVVENIEQHQGILDAALMRDEALIRSRIYSHLERNLVFDMPPELPKLPY